MVDPTSAWRERGGSGFVRDFGHESTLLSRKAASTDRLACEVFDLFHVDVTPCACTRQQLLLHSYQCGRVSLVIGAVPQPPIASASHGPTKTVLIGHNKHLQGLDGERL